MRVLSISYSLLHDCLKLIFFFVLPLTHADGLIAINKPYGVALQSRDGAGGGSPFSLADALPALENTLKCGKISPAKITERFTSGVSLFTTDQHAVDRIRKSYEVNHSLKILPMKYWAVTLGTPQPQESQVKVALSWITHQNDERKSVSLGHKFIPEQQ